MEAILNFINQTGFALIAQNWRILVMILISLFLAYLAIVKKFEPLLLLPIAFGMLLTNLPGAEMYHEILYAGGHPQWSLFGGAPITQEVIDAFRADKAVSESVLAF
ncbi:MAG: sodium ion-translocating decarboxylase subunit beta, partial [Clostridia bacterium]|nr:sodium ion-translocating decarboxylase subunit beta [Clostridia bacterium]